MRHSLAAIRRTLTLAAILLASGHALAGSSIVPNQTLFTLGASEPTSDGDVVTSSAGLNAPYVYYVEVPPGQASLVVEIFDADVLAGGTGDTGSAVLDNNRGSASSATYRLYPPQNPPYVPASATAAATFANTGNSTGSVVIANSSAHNVWVTLATVANPAAGHWRIEVTANTGEHGNAYGIRAHDGTVGTGGTEYNVYAESYVHVGTQSSVAKTVRLYPYITSSCTIFPREWDADNPGTTSAVTMTSRSGAFTLASTPLTSGATQWSTSPLAGVANFASAGVGVVPGSLSDGYGIWNAQYTSGPTGAGSNNIPVYIAGFNSPGAPYTGGNVNFAPNSQPEEDTFRLYFPRDGSTVANPLAPNKTFMRQSIYSVVSGPNPPDTGQTTVLTIEIEVVNPEAFAVNFSNALGNVVTSNVPGSGVTFQGPALVTQGTVISSPSNGGTGNVVWDPGAVAAGATARLRYNVAVSPALNGQVVPVTGSPGSNGTTGFFRDITGNATQTRTRTAFGPLCTLQVTEGGSVLAVNLVELNAVSKAEGDPVLVSWRTVEEIDNAGFLVYEAGVAADGTPYVGPQLTTELIPAGGEQGAEYRWTDARPWSSAFPRGYYLADIDLNGTVTHHGPVWVNHVVGTVTAIEDWKAFEAPAQ